MPRGSPFSVTSMRDPRERPVSLDFSSRGHMRLNSPAAIAASCLLGCAWILAEQQTLPAVYAQSVTAAAAARDPHADAKALHERGLVALDRQEPVAAIESLLDARA